MDEVVLVTGCRSGFGLGIAVEAARRGARVYAGLRDLDTADALVAASEGYDLTPIALDVTDPDQREAAVARILDEQGRIDVLVNNAGIALGGPLELVAEDELRRLFDVNFFGLWALTRACLPAMREAGRGRVINISSMAGRQAMPCLGAYAASKFALEGMSEAWRYELAPFGIDVVLVEPGAYKTDIFERNRTVARHARDEPAYRDLVDGMDDAVTRIVDRIARDPAEVVDLVTDLLTRRRPALRYAIGPLANTRAALMRLLPQRAVEGLVKLALGRARR